MLPDFAHESLVPLEVSHMDLSSEEVAELVSDMQRHRSAVRRFYGSTDAADEAPVALEGLKRKATQWFGRACDNSMRQTFKFGWEHFESMWSPWRLWDSDTAPD